MSDTVIILQDECILAAEGKAGRTPVVQAVERIPIDSFADPFEQWKNAVIQYKQRRNPSQLRLVLPASYSSARVTQIPFAKGKQLTRMAENVLAENGGEEISDYGIISADKKRGVCLCCAGAEKEFLEKLQNMIKELALPVRGVTVPMECYLNALGQMEKNQSEAAVVLIFEESSVVSILFRGGQYLYSTRSRIFSERGTLDFGTEIVRNISGILQFYSTTKSETPLTKVYYAGCETDDFEVSEDGLRGMNLEVHPLELEFQFEARGKAEDWLSCIGALTEQKGKSINLKNAWKTEAGKDGVKKQSLAKHLFYPGVTLGICLVAIAGVSVWNLVTEKQTEKLENWILDPQTQQAYEAASEKQNESELLMTAKNQVDQMTKNLSSYPDLDKEKINKIVDVGGAAMTVKIKTMDAESGTLTFNAASSDVIDIPGYIGKLTDTGLFSSVNYSGYSYNNGEYSLMLSCVLKGEEAGGEDQ